jgi:hypothetical protein
MRYLRVLSLVLVGSSLFAADTKTANVNTKEFDAKLRDYMKLRSDATSSIPKLDKKAEPAELSAHEQALATAIRKARPNARPGEILTPATQKYLRSLVKLESRGRQGTPVKETIKTGNPPLATEREEVPLKVNGAYPKEAPKSSMPASLLARFPKLPEELEFRFVGRTLVLLDTAANIIVDYAPEIGPSL